MFSSLAAGGQAVAEVENVSGTSAHGLQQMIRVVSRRDRVSGVAFG